MTTGRSVRHLFIKIRFVVARWLLLAWILAKFDVFLFKSGESFWSSCLDQRILRIFGKRIVHAYYGSDERPNYLAPDIDGHEDVESLRANVQRKKAALDFARKFSDITISNPLSAQFHQGEICILQALGIPIGSKKLEARHSVLGCADKRPGYVRILHAPSNPELKGSNVFRNEIKHLKEKRLQNSVYRDFGSLKRRSNEGNRTL